ncbi:MAG: PorT family protein [Bacteroidales bacterium]|nr:PorT family protein [Bacteroidales bacterium]
MKKLLAIVALVVLSATASFAQLGLRAGLNFASLGVDDKDVKDFIDTKSGFHIGAVYNVDLIGSFSLEPGLYFTQKGFKQDESDLKATTNYLEIPINLKYQLLDLSVIALDAHVGPFMSMGLSGKIKEDFMGAKEEFKAFDEDEGGLKRFEFGLQMGIGAKICEKLYAGIHYDMGLTKINEDDGISKDNLKETNHVWMVSVGLNF